MSKVLVSGLLSELPAGWSWQSLGDVLKVRNGFAFKSSDYQKSGVLLIRQTNLGGNRVSLDRAEYLPEKFLKDHKDFRIGKGDVLIGMSGSIGKLCVYDRDEPALQNQRTGLLQFKDNSLKSWIWRYLPLIESKLHEGGKGIGVQNISASQIEALPIPIAPKEHRIHLVAEIEKQFSRLDEAVVNLKRVKVNLKRYKAAVLKAAVEGKLTEDWRKQHPNVEPASKLLERILAERRAKWNGKGIYKEPIAPDPSNLSPLPDGWVWASVDQFAEVFLGKMLDKQKHRTGRKLPYLRNVNVRWGRVDTDDLLEMFFKSDELERYGLLSGDVLVCEGGEPGRAAVWDGRIPALKYQKALHRVRFNGKSEPRYLVFLLEFLANTGRLERWFTGSTIKHFTRDSFISLPIQIPPFKEQEQIVAEVERRLSVIEELEAAVQASLTRADRLRQSVLQSAFAGQLVPQGPNELMNCPSGSNSKGSSHCHSAMEEY